MTVSRTAPSSKPQTVFIVEDDRAVRDALCLLVEDEGIPVVAYPDGMSFLRHAAPTDADMVLLDLGLPGLSGADVAAALRSRGCRCPIAVISGLRGPAFDRGISAIKPVAAFRKPLDIPLLVDALSALPARP